MNCKYCNRECKNKNSLAQHEVRCKLNPNKLFIDGSKYSHPAWNKGLTKENDDRILNYSKTCSEHTKGKPGHPHSLETKERLSKVAKKRHLGGFNMRNAGIYYNGIKLDSSYEVMLAESLDQHNIRWKRCGRFEYHLNGETHYYTPDFYLPDYNVYLDPKNDFLINNVNPRLGFSDKDKINQVMLEHNIKIIILNKDQLTWDYLSTIL